MADKKDALSSGSSTIGGALHGNKQIQQSATIKDLPFDRQLVASKLAAALVMQGREDLSTAEVDKLIYFFILMVKLNKGRLENDESPLHFENIAKDIGLAAPTPLPKVSLSLTPSSAAAKPVGPAAASFAEDIFETESNEPETSSDAADKNAKAPEGNSSLESLTDSDLQTLLQNFKHLSTEEQHHLIAHLKKLETEDPARVERLRKFVNLNDLTETSGTSANSVAAQRSTNDASASSSAASNRAPSMSKHYEEDSLSRDRSHYSDEDEGDNSRQQRGLNVVNPNRFALDDEDDDDYNFEDVLKVASSNANKRTERPGSGENVSRAKAPTEPPAPGTLKSPGDALTFNRAAMNVDLHDTQNLIANLMGNLNQNNTSKHPTVHEAKGPVPSQPVPSLIGQKKPSQQPPQQAMPPAFYQQEQHPQYPQQQQQQQYGAQQQQYQQQQQYPGNAGYNQMGFNQAPYYNAGFNNAGYPQGAYPPQQWPGNQQPPMPPQMGGYNMYGGGN